MKLDKMFSTSTTTLLVLLMTASLCQARLSCEIKYGQNRLTYNVSLDAAAGIIPSAGTSIDFMQVFHCTCPTNNVSHHRNIWLCPNALYNVSWLGENSPEKNNPRGTFLINAKFLLKNILFDFFALAGRIKLALPQAAKLGIIF